MCCCGFCNLPHRCPVCAIKCATVGVYIILLGRTDVLRPCYHIASTVTCKHGHAFRFSTLAVVQHFLSQPYLKVTIQSPPDIGPTPEKDALRFPRKSCLALTEKVVPGWPPACKAMLPCWYLARPTYQAFGSIPGTSNLHQTWARSIIQRSLVRGMDLQ